MTEDKLVPVSNDLPDYLKGSTSDAGMEHFRPDDIQIPRLAIAQGLSPEVTAGDPKKIDGLEMGMLFNSLTRQVYGNEPLDFFVIKAAPARGVEFIPRKEGGGIKDRNVPLDDPRMAWGKNGEQPVATLFYDYVIVLAESKEIMGLSMKSTSIKTAKAFNGMMALRKQAIFTGRYSIGVAIEKNSEGTYGVYQILNAGWANKKEATELEALYEQFKDKVVDLQTEAEPADTEVEVEAGIKF